MPSLHKIAKFWKLDARPRCVRCLIKTRVYDWRQADGLLERAHIIDRCWDGLDEVHNLAPLCSFCHACQPMFKSGDEIKALKWFGLLERDEILKKRLLRKVSVFDCGPINFRAQTLW